MSANTPATTRHFFLTPGRFRVLALMCADALTLTVIWFALVQGYRLLGTGDYHSTIYLKLWPILPTYIIINIVFRLYHGNCMYPAMPVSPVEEFRRLVASSFFLHLLLMSSLAFTRLNLEYSRFIVASACVLIAFFAQPVRNLVRFILHRLNICQIPVAISGGGNTFRRIIKNLDNDPYMGFKIALAFENDKLRHIVPESQKRDIKILLACQDERLFKTQFREFTEWFSYIEYLPQTDVFPVLGSHAINIDGIGGLEMVNQRRMKAVTAEKRIIDTLLSILVFAASLPFFVILPILIKLTSKGPVFYKAHRLGKKGRPIEVWKFRSMYADADKRLSTLLADNAEMAKEFNKNFKLKNDPRVTPLGSFMRKTSLDELPQLFNVFLGDMALVGPRPIVEDEVSYYGSDYEIVSHVKPGITGLWQSGGRSGIGYDHRVALDTFYVLNWSPWLDVWIVIRTVWSVLSMRGAY